tara:strand:+ start:4026 stop:4808 length:783 start_codon:yes stop_codon:yes gene_type:complete
MTIHHGLRAAAGNVGEPDTLVTDDLVFHLDASNSNSYGGSGNTWSDISGNGEDHTLTSLGANTSLLWQYVSAGDASYFNQHFYNSTTVNFLTGNACSGYGVTSAATVEIWMMSESTTYNTVFKFFNNVTSGQGRALMSHINYGSGSSADDYFDVNGCCGAYNRISGSYTDSSLSSPVVRQYVWRFRPGTNPQREIIKNTVSIHDSGSYSTYGGSWTSGADNYFGNRMDGRWYIIRFYKKALTDAEITTNFNRDKARFGIS